jgi:hypothetical protein
VYTIDGKEFRSVRRVFDPEEGVYRDGETFELELSV